jgi:hypothetical protein
MYKLFSIFLGFLILNSCVQETNPNTFLKQIGVDLEDDYVVISLENSQAIGDLLVNFDLKLGEIGYDLVIQNIKNHESFRILDSLECYPNGLIQNTSSRQEFSCKRNNIFYKHLYKPISGSDWESYTLFVDQDSILEFQYVNE